MKVFSYVVVADTGFAPNPLHGYLTLACCKPAIRRAAETGDLVVGLSSRCECVVYAMRVGEHLPFSAYWSDPRFKAKRPRSSGPAAHHEAGDNIYEPLGATSYRQHPSRHSNADGTENAKQKARDLSSDRALVAKDFVYFGGDGPELPAELAFLRVARGHRCRFTPAQVAAVQQWYGRLPRGARGKPAHATAEVGEEFLRRGCGCS